MANVILLEVINNALRSVAEQMSATMVRSSYSTIVKEMMDCSSAIFDGNGRLLAEGANIPIHLNCLGPCLNTVLTKYFSKEDLNPGDLILTNHPYAGGESLGSHHTKDLIMIAPVFHNNNELIAFSMTMLHHKDVGGVWTGDSWTVEIWQEGFLLEPIKLYDKGIRNEALWNVILNNTRTPRDMKGDLMAQISACNIGIKGFKQIVKKYGLELVKEVTEDLLNYSERLTRNEIRLIRDGSYTHEEKILDDGFEGGPYNLKLTVIVEGDNITFDYTGTDKQIRGPINSPLSATISATYYAMRCITNADIPSNQGCQRPIKVIAPEGTLVNCQMPIGCFQRMVTDHILVDLIMGAMANAIPNKVMADSCGTNYDFCSGTNLETHPRGGEITHRQYWGEIVPGGLGARSDKDGITIMSCHVTNCPIPPLEAQEIEAPMLFIERSILPDSEGAGKFRSGFAQRRKWKLVGHDGIFSHVSQKSKIPPQGMHGGKHGNTSKWIINEGKEDEKILDYAMGDVIFLNYGDTITCITASGGGYGNPLERDMEKVKEDVEMGLVSIENAKLKYGVVINPITHEIDYEESNRLRNIK
ncbi:hydantoinase B/oxoprolinase family protein [Tissierella sp.]|uniref:hydantoinase B/oxoprolinase family protein n=1 Tax=Tissierella sp. TaxID=41274 RepID=UPI00302BC12E